MQSTDEATWQNTETFFGYLIGMYAMPDYLMTIELLAYDMPNDTVYFVAFVYFAKYCNYCI